MNNSSDRRRSVSPSPARPLRKDQGETTSVRTLSPPPARPPPTQPPVSTEKMSTKCQPNVVVPASAEKPAIRLMDAAVQTSATLSPPPSTTTNLSTKNNLSTFPSHTASVSHQSTPVAVAKPNFQLPPASQSTTVSKLPRKDSAKYNATLKETLMGTATRKRSMSADNIHQMLAVAKQAQEQAEAASTTQTTTSKPKYDAPMPPVKQAGAGSMRAWVFRRLYENITIFHTKSS